MNFAVDKNIFEKIWKSKICYHTFAYNIKTMKGINFEEFIDTKSLDKMAELYPVLCEERLSAKETGVRYRTLNHWDEMKIIRFTRTSDIGNRKFNFVDFIWIKIVNELRSFGLNLNTIKQIANGVYESIPMQVILEQLAINIDKLQDFEAEDKEEFINFLKSGEYKNADFSEMPFQFNLLHILITEAIATRQSVAIIVFNNGEWLPFFKDNEHLYPEELLYKINYHSQIRVNITDLIFKFIVEDYLNEYLTELKVFTKQEEELLGYVLKGDYKKVFVLFKSKKNEPVEIPKSIQAQEAIVRILREKEYREFILTDKKGKEFRIRAKANEVLN
jgi:DNA-binding transcriptional MerR regulator